MTASEKRKADFAELLNRYEKSQSALALHNGEVNNERRDHLRAQVLATFNGLVDLAEAQRESGGAS